MSKQLMHEIIMLPTEKSNSVGDIVQRPSDGQLAIINVLTTGDKQPSINQYLYLISDYEIKIGDIYLMRFDNEWELMEPCLDQEEADRCNKDYSISPKCKKVIASNNPELTVVKPVFRAYLEKNQHLNKSEYIKLPTFSEDFVKVYVASGGIGKVSVEYDLIDNTQHSGFKMSNMSSDMELALKITNGEVIISAVKNDARINLIQAIDEFNTESIDKMSLAQVQDAAKLRSMLSDLLDVRHELIRYEYR